MSASLRRGLEPTAERDGSLAAALALGLEALRLLTASALG
jgi:hypothetical protein